MGLLVPQRVFAVGVYIVCARAQGTPSGERYVLLLMLRFKTALVVSSLLMLATSAFAVETIDQDTKFMVVAQRFQIDFGISLKLARVDNPVFAKNYTVTALKPEHQDNALQILT